MDIVENATFDEERALYGSKNLIVKNCAFDGEADGESALKECENIKVENTFFNLRYPLWHIDGLSVTNCNLTSFCRAAIWYSNNITIEKTKMLGIKAVRECSHITIKDCEIVSPEFGWFSSGIKMQNVTAESEYFLMRTKNIHLSSVTFKGKYSFQYIKNAVFENCKFDTKDAFWHAENVTVKNCLVKGEYLGWYSNGLTFENCKIIGTQPLCYCKNLRLINCEMIDADLAFEKSQVEATITTPVISIKNPMSGKIVIPTPCEIIRDDALSKGEIIIKEN